VVQWNQIAGRTLAADRTYGGPTWASRNMAIVQAAVFDAVESITRHYQPLFEHHVSGNGASLDAAVASAAYEALVTLFPGQKAALDLDLSKSLNRAPNSQARHR